MIFKKRILIKFKRKDIILISLIFIFLLTRIIILFNSPYLYLETDSECYIGTIAKEIIEGPKFPLSQYPLTSYYPGSIFSGMMTVPFFLIFGESGISLKLVALFMSLLTLIVLYLFLNKFFNQKSAIFFGLLFIFSMPFYTKNNLISLGYHQFPLLFDAIIMLIFYNIFFDNKKDIKHFLLFGFMCGFAAWFSFQSLVMIFTCLLFWFIFDKKFFLKKYFLIFFIGLLIGYSPGIYYNLTNNFQGVFDPKLEQGLGSIDLNSNLIMKAGGRFLYITSQHIPHSFGQHIPHSFGFVGSYFLYGKFISYLYYLIFLFAFFIIFWRCRKSIFKLVRRVISIKIDNIPSNKIKKEIFILAYPLIFLLIYSFSNFEIEGKTIYLLTIYPFILIVLSLFIAKLWGKKVLKPISVFIITILLLAGLIGNLSLISFNNPYNGNKIYEPYCYNLLADIIGSKSGINSINSLCEKFDLEYQKYCYKGFSIAMIETKCDSYDFECSIQICNQLDLNYRKYCYEIIGFFLYEKNESFYNENIDGLKKGLDICNLVDPEYKDYCYKGFCEHISSSYAHNPKEIINKCNKMDSICREYCYDGLALVMEMVSRENYKNYPDAIKCIDLERRLIISRNKTICFLNLVN